ncbi:hypothetical protein GBA52_029146 [Prunus armeniaca]|nr:hypothetical protein GBA52_029146 [Prunus armeniaca]
MIVARLAYVWRRVDECVARLAYVRRRVDDSGPFGLRLDVSMSVACLACVRKHVDCFCEHSIGKKNLNLY